jgi:hypothetical protein
MITVSNQPVKLFDRCLRLRAHCRSRAQKPPMHRAAASQQSEESPHRSSYSEQESFGGGTQ